MENRNKNAAAGDVGFASILFFIFLVLKLTGVISWSWWWVTSPLWISLALAVLTLAILFLVYLIKGD